MDLPADPEPQVDYEKDQVHMSIEIVVESGAKGFAENKDEARAVRLSKVLPAVTSGNTGRPRIFVPSLCNAFLHSCVIAKPSRVCVRALEHIRVSNLFAPGKKASWS